ncbi:hypothetical protein AURDEDRAFT_112966 [Auricularia subglabra TFB-10046 SS5]|nr:hypothetical protein AURDEDRAFT_112966 [Auricularia subglabra TFB-10046 SS5]
MFLAFRARDDLEQDFAPPPDAPLAATASPVDDQRCRLLGPTALVVQGLLGVLVILSLVYKRHRETPKRKWRIWLFDVSKQVVGQIVVHVTNVGIASLVGHVKASNPCAQYFLHVGLDTTVGVGVLYLFLKLFTYILDQKLQMKGFESGQYGDPPSLFFWSRQAAVYVVSLLCMKLFVLAIVGLAPFFTTAVEWLLAWAGPSLQVIIVMGIFPIIMNILQFWMIDSIVKASAAAGAVALATPSDELEREPMFAVASDDEDDDASEAKPPGRPRHAEREHSYPPGSRSGSEHSRPSSPVPGAVAPPPPAGA